MCWVLWGLVSKEFSRVTLLSKKQQCCFLWFTLSYLFFKILNFINFFRHCSSHIWILLRHKYWNTKKWTYSTDLLRFPKIVFEERWLFLAWYPRSQLLPSLCVFLSWPTRINKLGLGGQNTYSPPPRQDFFPTVPHFILKLSNYLK